MDPQTLAAYLAVLPRNVLQLELTSGDFTIKLNLDHAGAIPEPAGSGDVNRDGSVIPRDLLEAFPQLAKAPLG